MQALFTDLVGTAIVPAHSFDNDELTALTPALETATAVDGTGRQASEAASSPLYICPSTNSLSCLSLCDDELTDLAPVLDTTTAVHAMAAQASEAAYSHLTNCGCL